MMTDSLYTYDDIWPVVIRQHISDSVISGVPYVTMSDEKTLIEIISCQLSINVRYGIISNSKQYDKIALMSQDIRKVIISDVIHLPARKWGIKENRDNFVISMILRAYFERSDTFNWTREKVISYFKGLQV